MNSMLTITETARGLEFTEGDRCFAVYAHLDAFKPYFHPLCTPAGHCLSLAKPHDHKHHKGLMYALRTPELNFWEEYPGGPGEGVGRQRHLGFDRLTASGAEVGFVQRLSWEPAEGGDALFREVRTIRVRRAAERPAYVWSWSLRLEVLRACELIQSPWSFTGVDGSKTNYHGLGIRLRREFGGGTQANALALDGLEHANTWDHKTDFTDFMGQRPQTVGFIGSIDGFETAPRGSVTFRQVAQRHALFVMEAGFAFMALGPSNGAPVSLRAGTHLDEAYEIEIGDVG